MTHPPSGPSQPPRPSGPKLPQTYTHPLVTPLDPDSPEGLAAAEALSEVLADIWVAILRRRAAKQLAA
ncbi:hypothetical protein [Micromonospora rubida]|uniref:hypothetical protein n=1 Tax=Micromonospora rubida TaxID=2697657 RepID=UPI001378AF8F|nr:hypothetical protein [Micromonospora rubida]NBE80348.1 hypothetical protein [Micromonospora rubida]